MEREQQQVRQALVVLGMHRSGTSAISGALHHMGATMPRTPMPGTPNNPFGHFESLKVWKLNEEILKATRSSWDDCVRFDTDWLTSSAGRETALRAQAVLAEEYGSDGIVLLKDPRICRFFVFWRTVLEDAGLNPVVVHIHRDPLEVAASLNRRNGLSTNLGQLLWLRHVLDAEEQSRGLPRVFVDYASLLGDWAGTIGKISATLRLEWPTSSDQVQDAMSEFLRPELRHFDGSSLGSLEADRRSSWVRETYQIFESWAQVGEQAPDRARLDRIRAEFDGAVPAFIPLVQDARAAGVQVKALSAEVERAKASSASHESRAAALAASLAQTREAKKKVEAAIQKVRTTLLERDAEARRLKQRLDEVTRQLELTERRYREGQDELVILTDRVLKTEAYKEELLSSTSWRLTAPLRGLSRLLGKQE